MASSPPPPSFNPQGDTLSDSVEKQRASSVFRIARRLAVINVGPGSGTLEAALRVASSGDELVLADGSYTGTGLAVRAGAGAWVWVSAVR
eukprot:2807350-Prymnesium_polylepis.1